MEQIDQYKAVMTEIIAKQGIILGPDMAIMRAKKISEIELSPEGIVLSIKGDSADALRKLIDTYVELSGQIVKSALGPIFTKYPNIEGLH